MIAKIKMFLNGEGGRLYHLSHVWVFRVFFALTKINNITHVKNDIDLVR